MKTVIFDLDGTLADTSADLIAAANTCFIGLGHGAVLDPVGDARTAFRGGRAMLTLGFERLGKTDARALIAAQYPVLIDAYSDAIDVHTRLYDGAVEAVEALKSEGYSVGICTNKPEALADRLLVSLGVRGLFASLIGAQTVGVSKPDPKPYVAAVEAAGGAVAQSCLIGDTQTDRDTARAAGVPCALVTFGPDGEGVRALAPEAYLASYQELGPTVREMIG